MTAAPAAARAAWAGSDASAATPCAPAGACPPRLTARTSRPACSNSVTTVLPMAPVAPKTTCQESSGSVIVMLLLLAPMGPGRRACLHEFFRSARGDGPPGGCLPVGGRDRAQPGQRRDVVQHQLPRRRPP